MLYWNIEATDKYERDAKWYRKKHPDELEAVSVGLNFYLETLKIVGNPLHVTGKFIHREPKGIIALDQTKGKRKTKLQETRLYIYPHIEKKVIYLLAIGDKQSQKTDIKNCVQKLRKIK